ncbi:PAS domain S-box protein [Tuwongella immobilis]|uniref:PAS domain-containing protein n=1 Tax=Tuwongella immobilis TaxID=692036 RepID=A0A6C2YH63_9BACT|nr:PAS domain S-box protein [Tuwongella immobilis]VIP00581.1 pas domain s-box protein : Diguanylate cyclase OS=Marichromatium purpuratum 984 GN=MARPU_04545 PE=4 SV=1: PAS_9 [Tuwongella immobilis]VTR96580.1 pas domain s-box protein : Diguanylate cyclase OS=Marichromatium purpuratum 984 GN=MARPU_04545 PE=4 SV=1: PAS_9 [Tuwongella immobilis]
MLLSIKKFMQTLDCPACLTTGQLEAPHPRIMFANSAFEELTGYTLAELLFESPRIFQGPQTDRRVLDLLKNSLVQHRSFEGYTINYRKDGTPFGMGWLVSTVFDGGRPQYYLSMHQECSAAQLEWTLSQIRLQQEALKDWVAPSRQSGERNPPAAPPV